MTKILNAVSTETNDLKTLVAAIKKARKECDGGASGLSATRRVYHDDIEWIVDFDDDAQHLTVITEDYVQGQSDEEIAETILGCWDADWDDIQIDHPVGDFSLGSSDFKQRNLL